jgi:hypothetical protein
MFGSDLTGDPLWPITEWTDMRYLLVTFGVLSVMILWTWVCGLRAQNRYFNAERSKKVKENLESCDVVIERMRANDHNWDMALRPFRADRESMIMTGTRSEILLIDRFQHGPDRKPEFWVPEVGDLQALPVGVVLIPCGELEPAESGSGNGMVNVTLFESPPVNQDMPDSLHSIIRLAPSFPEYGTSAD